VHKRLLLTILSLFLMAGCGATSIQNGIDAIRGKEEKQYNKSAQKWYDEICQDLARGELESADKKYLSLRSEHMNSALVPMSMILLAEAHMAEQEYLLANYYLDEYLKISRGAKADYANFLKIKSSFLGIKDINKDQKLVMDTLFKARNFYTLHRNSQYAPLVQSMIVRLEMAQYVLNDSIASLYDRIGKSEASKIYREKNKKFIYTKEQIESPKSGFVSKIIPFK
jgi:outer membrane protein assembly factor BamD